MILADWLRTPPTTVPGSFAASPGHALCSVCEAGKFMKEEIATACRRCSAGSYCLAGSTTPVPCPAGTFANASGLSTEGSCAPVLSGYWSPMGSVLPMACPSSGFFCPGREVRYLLLTTCYLLLTTYYLLLTADYLLLTTYCLLLLTPYYLLLTAYYLLLTTYYLLLTRAVSTARAEK